MKHTSLVFLLAAALSLGTLAGCTDSAPSGPTAGLGGATVTKYVSIGNSLTAGYQSNALYASAQAYSYPNLIATQLKSAGAALGTFEQPLYSDPGTPDPANGKASRYEIISLVGPVIGPKGLTPGAPTNSTLARPYDNLGIPGIVIKSFLDTTNFTSNPLVPLVLRYGPGSPFPKSIYKHVAALAANPATKPDLVTFWLGNNDVLGFATSGGFSPSTPTPAAGFTALYTEALTALRTLLPDAKIVVGTIPDVRSIPFFTTVGPKMAAGIAGAKLVYTTLPGMFYQKHGVTGVSTSYTSLNLANDVLITLTGSPYAGLLGKPGGQWYKDKKYPGLPAGIDTTKPFGFDPQNPWPDALALDLDEQVTAGDAVLAFNNTIRSVGESKGAAIADMNVFFSGIKAHGIMIAGEKFTTDYVSGGLFSLDGVHPSSKGAAIVANEFIRVINQKWSMNIGYSDVSRAPGIPAPLSKYANSAVVPTISFEGMRHLVSVMGGKL